MVRGVRRRSVRKWLVAVAAMLLSLAGLEAAVRGLALDWRFLARNLYWYAGYPQLHVADPHPDLAYRLRPNSEFAGVGHYGRFTMRINSLGARGREQSAAKAPGVYRIVCVGGSNVFGTEVSDDQTWPAQLESSLAGGAVRYETVNLGTSAQVAAQSAFLAREALANLQPDLLLFCLSNAGKPAFIIGAPIAPYFARDPSLWDAQLGGLARRAPAHAAETWLLTHSATARLAALIAANCAGRRDLFEERNVSAFRSFVREAQARVRIAIFVGPYVSDEQYPSYEPYFRDLDVPVFRLAAPNSSREYRMLHPPPVVLAWQAGKIAEWLRDTGLVPSGEP
jgi:hypothetical protein